MISDGSLTPTMYLVTPYLFDAARTSKWNDAVNV